MTTVQARELGLIMQWGTIAAMEIVIGVESI
jgi:hypothetical protein